MHRPALGNRITGGADPALISLADDIRNSPVQLTLFGLGFLATARGALWFGRSRWTAANAQRWTSFAVALLVATYLPQFFLPPAGRIVHGLTLGGALIAWAIVNLRAGSSAESPAKSSAGASSVDHGPSARSSVKALSSHVDRHLTPRTHFTMAADGSSGTRSDGAGIPNIDSVKATIRTYYGADSTGIAGKTSSPYIAEMNTVLAKQAKRLKALYAQSAKGGKKPAIVFDADDTTLWTYDMEDHDMHFNFDPAAQDVWVQSQKFPAVPGMVDFVKQAKDAGFAIFGLTGRNDDRKAATVANLNKVGFTGFTSDRFYTKWTGKGTSQQPSYITCAAVKCTTVEYKAGTRKHIESQGFDIALNVGDQFSDLQGGFADHTLKLPNPTYYLPSPNLPVVTEPKLAPRTRFTMAADGSSGATQSSPTSAISTATCSAAMRSRRSSCPTRPTTCRNRK